MENKASDLLRGPIIAINIGVQGFGRLNSAYFWTVSLNGVFLI